METYFIQFPVGQSSIYESLGNNFLEKYIFENELNIKVEEKESHSIFHEIRYQGYKYSLIAAWVMCLIGFAFFLLIVLQVMYLKKEKNKMIRNNSKLSNS
jgi:hypothetical protein